jgi:hypothetical protein
MAPLCDRADIMLTSPAVHAVPPPFPPSDEPQDLLAATLEIPFSVPPYMSLLARVGGVDTYMQLYRFADARVSQLKLQYVHHHHMYACVLGAGSDAQIAPWCRARPLWAAGRAAPRARGKHHQRTLSPAQPPPKGPSARPAV